MACTITKEPQSRSTYLVAIAVVIAAGLLSRWPWLGLPWPVAKWSGSILWAAMVHLIVAAVRPGASTVAKVGVAATIAIVVEVSRLYHAPWLDTFRITTAGALLLGRIFSPWNLVAYAIGITLAATGETLWMRRRATPRDPVP